MPAPLLVPAIIGLCKVCAFVGGTMFCVHKAAKAYEKGQKTKREKYSLKGKSIEAVKEDNKQAQQEITEWKKKYDELDQKEQELLKKLQDLEGKVNNSNIPSEEKKKYALQIVNLQNELDEIRKQKKDSFDKIKGLENRIKSNNSTISGIGSNTEEKHWIWDFLTLDTILVVGGCFLIYKLLKDKDK